MNFFCISRYDTDVDWLKDYPNPHVIYDKTWNGISEENYQLPPSDLKNKYPNYNIINTSPNGYNIYDYLTFIIDNYENLPPVISFIKSNVIGRHVSKEMFDRLVNNKCFTAIEDWLEYENIDCNKPSIQNNYILLACDGGFMETNDSWYCFVAKHTKQYFNTYNDFIKFCFVDPIYPKYVRFAPGANYVVPRDYILKYNKTFYENLRTFVSYSRLPTEAHIIERALYTIWTCNYKVTEIMSNPLI